MKALLAILVSAWTFFAFAGEDYLLTINGRTSDLSLGVEKAVTLTNGQTVSVLLKRKETATFDGRLFSFSYKSSLTPQGKELGEDVRQTLLTTPTGTAVIIQEYKNFNPADVVDLMITKLTEDEVKSGYKAHQEKIEQKLSDGRVFKGKKVVTTSREEEWTRCVLTYGDAHGGVLVMTMISKDNAEELPMIETFWSSFRLKMETVR